MSTTKEQQPTDQEKRIADALGECRDALERVANTDTPFASRAEAALEWLDDHQEGDDDE